MKQLRNLLTFIVLFQATFSLAQPRNEEAWSKAKEAIKLMDAGEIDKSIALLEECQKLDKNDYTYPYEIAYAYMLKKDYAKAAEILDKTKKYKNITNQIYQMSGNCYSYLGQPEKAIQEYDEGLSKFPNSGNLYLEKGNIFLLQKKYDEAILNYNNGIKVEPMFASNYYRLTKLYAGSTDKLSALLYGEIFLNLERTSKRTLEVSKILFDTYKTSIKIDGDEASIEFCDVIVDASDLSDKELKLPLCAIFGKNFILGIINQKEVKLQSLSEIRTSFVNNFYQEDYKKYPNALFAYQKKLLDNGDFESYNHYLFQMGSEEEFKDWKGNNEAKYNKFVTWYTNPENYLKLDKSNRYINH